MRSGESIFQYVTYFDFHCVLFVLVKNPSALDFAPHSAKELSFVVPAVLLLLLVVVAVASAVPDTRAQPTLQDVYYQKQAYLNLARFACISV